MAASPEPPVPSGPSHAQLNINLPRLESDWRTLSDFRSPDAPGWSRRPFTPEYAAARAWLAERMADAGLDVRLDAAGNLIGRRAGARDDLPPLVAGSHTDTVMGGGRFDGIIGVLGGLEAARSLRDAGIRLQHPLEVIDFLAEEPTDFGISTVGSRALAGALPAEALALRDPTGRTLADAIAAAGGRPDQLGTAVRPPGSVALYLELHIEQGPMLERERVQVGIVTAITGIRRLRIEIEGRPDHAGTTPMDLRRDALATAAEIILALESLCADGRGVGTAGRLHVAPNAANVVPGAVELWVEVRSVDPAVLEERERLLRHQIHDIAARRHITVRAETVSREEPVPLSHHVQSPLEHVARKLGLSTRRLPSYAGHDANHLATIAPTGMLFVPSKAGRSHCPEEWTDLPHVGSGVTVLTHALLHFDRETTLPSPAVPTP